MGMGSEMSHRKARGPATFARPPLRIPSPASGISTKTPDLGTNGALLEP